jgi:hypothetical protein
MRIRMAIWCLASFTWCSGLCAQTVSDGIGIDGLVCLGQSRKMIKRNLGKNYSNEIETTTYDKRTGEEKTKTGHSGLMWSYRALGILLLFEKNKVASISIGRASYVTTRGLRVGDEWSKVIETYGPSIASHSAYYPDDGVSFEREGDVVSRIEVYQTSTSPRGSKCDP